MRDDFAKAVVETLAKRVGNRCSNPKCRKLTSGPHSQDDKSINVGVAAHITAASLGGPRYDSSLTSDQRKAATNGIWLCQSCSKLIDSDMKRYTVDLLESWKQDAEAEALKHIESQLGTTERSKSATDIHSSQPAQKLQELADHLSEKWYRLWKIDRNDILFAVREVETTKTRLDDYVNTHGNSLSELARHQLGRVQEHIDDMLACSYVPKTYWELGKTVYGKLGRIAHLIDEGD